MRLVFLMQKQEKYMGNSDTNKKQALSRAQCAGIVGGQASVSISAGDGAVAAATVTAIGTGFGAAKAIAAAGGLANLGSFGTAAPAMGGALAGGFVASGLAGLAVGTFAYDHSETVQNVSQAVVGAGVRAVDGIGAAYTAWETGIGEHSCTYAYGGGGLNTDESYENAMF